MIISVNGFEEAKAYPVMFGTTELMMDATKDIFYIKAVDRMGKYVMSTYEFHQIENEKPLTSADFISKEQFNDLNAKLDNIMTFLSQPSSTRPVEVETKKRGGSKDGQ